MGARPQAGPARRLAAFCLPLLLAVAARAAVVEPVGEVYGEPANDWKSLSPKGGIYARAETYAISLTIPNGSPTRFIRLGTSPLLGGFHHSPPPLHWDEGSDAIWLIWPQDRSAAARAAIGGAITRIDPPDADARPLDGLLYVNGRGLAVATYATRWAADRAGPPTLAAIDLAGGRLLGSLRLDGDLPADGSTGSASSRSATAG